MMTNVMALFKALSNSSVMCDQIKCQINLIQVVTIYQYYSKFKIENKQPRISRA